MAAEITKAGSMSHDALYLLLVSIQHDLAALKDAVDSHDTALGALETTVNAVITAAATDLAAVAAVTASAIDTTAVGDLGTTVEGE